MTIHTVSDLDNQVVTIRFFVRADDDRVEEKTSLAKVYYRNGRRHAFAFHPKHGDRVRFIEHPYIPDAWIPLMETPAWSSRDSVARPHVA